MRIINFLLLILLSCTVFFFNTQDTSAKTAGDKCSYYAPPNELRHPSGVHVNCTIYTDYSHECSIKFAGKIKKGYNILNWKKPLHTGFVAKEYYKQNNKCPDILFVRVKTEMTDKYKIYAADNNDTLSKLIEYQTNKKDISNWYDAYISSYEHDQETKDKYYNIVDDRTDHMNKELEIIDDIGDQKELANKLEALGIYYRSAESFLEGYITAGYVEEKDPRIIDFRNTVELVKEKIDEYDVSAPPLNGGGINIGAGERINCDDFTYEEKNAAGEVIETYNLIAEVFSIILIAGPILLIIFGALDFAKASLASDEQALKKAGANFGKRIIAVVLLFVLPLIINLLLKIAFDAGIFTGGVPAVCVEQDY